MCVVHAEKILLASDKCKCMYKIKRTLRVRRMACWWHTQTHTNTHLRTRRVSTLSSFAINPHMHRETHLWPLMENNNDKFSVHKNVRCIIYARFMCVLYFATLAYHTTSITACEHYRSTNTHRLNKCTYTWQVRNILLIYVKDASLAGVYFGIEIFHTHIIYLSCVQQ